MPIQYLYPTLYSKEASMPNWYINGDGTMIKPDDSIPTEIDEGTSLLDTSDFLSFSNYGGICGLLEYTRNYVIPSSLTLNITYSSEYFLTGGFHYISGAFGSVILRNKYTTNTIGVTSFPIESGLVTKSVPFTILGQMDHPIDYDSYITFGVAPASVFSSNNIYALEIISSGTTVIQDNNCTLLVQNNTGIINYLPLYIYGRGPSSGNLDLFIQQQRVSGVLDLYTKAATNKSGNITLHTISYSPASGNPTLYVHQQNGASGIPLHLLSFLNASGDITLHTQAGVHNAPMNMHTFSKSGNPISSIVNLSIYSTTNSGIFNSIPLMTQGEVTNNHMNLVITNTDVASNTGNMNLVINSEDATYKYCTLFLQNDGGTVDSGANFYIKGNGLYDGAHIGTGSMNLMINREHESIAGNTPFFIAGPSGILNSIPMIIDGATIINNNISMSISGYQPTAGNTSLYSHGY